MKKLLLLLIIIGFIFQTKAQISAIPPTLTFSYVEGQAAPSEQSVSVNSFGSNDITVTSSFPFSVSNTSGGGYSTSTTLPPGLSTLYVVIESGLIANNYSGIINFDDGSQTNTLPVDGFVTPVSATPTVIYFPLSFETFTANPNTNSAEQSIFVTGTDLAGDIFFDVSAGSDFEVSVSSGGIFGDQVKINQGVGSGTIYVRMKPGANTIALDNLSISTSGLIPSQSISLFGERILPPISITSINPNPLVRGGEVTITGSRFFAPIEVFIPGRAKISTTILDTNTFTFPFPSNYAQNTVTITFTGASKSIVQTYPVIGSVLPPDISLITPGRISAFNQLLVYGSNFPDINSLAINLGGKASIVNNAQLALLELYPSTGISAKGQIQVVDTQSGLQSTSTQHFFTSYFPSNTTITSQSFGVPNVLNIGTDVTSFESADFDGDNKMDIAVLSATNNSITFLKNPFISANSTLALSDNYGTIKYVDFNGDGKLDLFAWGKSTNKLSVFLNTSNSATGISFNPTPVSITTTNNMNDATFFDFNKDGKIDILASQQGSSALEFWLNNTSISGLSFNSSPFLYSTATISSGISAQNITIIDRDNDNDMDLVLQDVSDPNAYYNLENNSTVGSISFNYDGTFPGTNLTTDIKVANVNGSSDNSIIAIQNPGSSLNIISYASGYNYNTKNTNIAITKFETGNFDGDNYNDIAAIMPSTNQVGVFRVADSSGTPSHIYNPILLNTQSNPIDIDVEDYNNDGQPDIAVLNAGSQSVQIFPNVAGQITSLSITGFRNEITLLNDTIVLGFEYNPQDANQFDLDWTVTGVGEAVLDYYQSYNATDKIILTAIDNGVVTVTATTLQKVKAQYIITISGQVAPPDILSSAMQLVPGDKYSVTTLTTQGLAKILSSPPGVSQTWNITNAVTTGDSSLVEIVDAFSTPYFFSNFLNSVLASKKDDKYTYYSYSFDGSLVELGTASPNSIDSVTFVRFDPLKDFSLNSTSYPSEPYSIRNASDNYFRRGVVNSTYHYDAYGTLQLPDRNVKVGRIKVENNFNILQSTPDTVTTTYYFYEENEKYPIVEVHITSEFDCSQCRTDRFRDTLVLLRKNLIIDTISTGPITNIQITNPKTDTTVQVGDFVSFQARLTPSNASTLFLGWSVSPDSGAFILPNGDFYSFLPGRYTVKAFSFLDSSIFDTRQVTVKETNLSTLQITKPSADTVILTDSYIQFEAITIPVTTISSDIVWQLQIDIDYSKIPIDPLSGLPLDTNAFKNLGANIDFNGKFYAYIPGTYTVIGFAASNPNIFDYRIVTVTGDAVISVTSVALIEQDTIRVLSPLDPFLIMNPIFQPANATDKDIEWSTIPVNSTLVGIETFPGFALASVIGDGNGVVTILGRSKSNPNAFGMWVVTVVGKETLKPDKLVTSTTGDPCQGELVLKSPNQNGLDYQWFLNSLKIRGADQPNYRAVVSGSYTLIVLTDGNVAETYPPFNVSISNIVVPTISGVGSPITLITSSRDVASNTSDTITQWYLNNRLIRGATGRKLDIYYNGKYYATNKSGNCRIQSNILEVNEPNYVNLQRSGLIYTDSTIENYSNGPIGNSINIYPNPTSGLYNLDYYTSSKIGLSYQIFNYMGQTVVERTLTKVSIGLQTDSFDLSVFGKGIYYISINEENHKSKCIKIVVQ